MLSKKSPNHTSTDTQDDFLQQLYQRRGGIKLGLGRVADAFPVIFDKKIPVYHVAGTNGKGTAVYALDHILCSNGLKTGRFVSPHLLRYNERISVDGIDIADSEVREIYRYIEKRTSVFDELSFFEITFLIAWKYFELKGCDRAVFEVGLGGRLDATNVIEGPKTDIITSIGLDHTHILGDTLEKIALEKLGIVKNGDRVLIGRGKDPSFDKWMSEIALSKGAESVDDDSFDPAILFPLSCISPEQKKNIRLAVKAALMTEGKGFKVPDFGKMMLPARFEFIEPDIVTDVAHNPPAIESLVETVRRKLGGVVVLYGAMKDKDVTKVLDLIGGITDSIFIINLEADNDRGAKVGDILERAGSSVAHKLKYTETDEKTIEQAVSFARKNGKTLLVTGSFHTVEKFMCFRNKLSC